MTQCPGQDKRLWKPEDIYDVDCPNCSAEVEFWKDDIYRRCKKCGHRFRNPKLDLGCARWCQYAKYCIGRDISDERTEEPKSGRTSSSVLRKEGSDMITMTKPKTKRQIIKTDEDKCTGCGECIPNCPEGALQIIDGKVRLISDLFCDGLGACIGHCPEGAITTEEREAEPYDERKVMANIVKQGKNVIRAHLQHLKEHNQAEYLTQAMNFLKEKKMEIPLEEPTGHKLPCGCPGTAVRSFQPKSEVKSKAVARVSSTLSQWPVQLALVPPNAPFLQGRDLMITADCVSYAYGNFHQDFLKDKALVIACPKLDDTEYYLDKLTQMFKSSNIKSVTVVHMEVPCCSGIVHLTKQALANANKQIPTKEITIGIKGDIKAEQTI